MPITLLKDDGKNENINIDVIIVDANSNPSGGTGRHSDPGGSSGGSTERNVENPNKEILPDQGTNTESVSEISTNKVLLETDEELIKNAKLLSNIAMDYASSARKSYEVFGFLVGRYAHNAVGFADVADNYASEAVYALSVNDIEALKTSYELVKQNHLLAKIALKNAINDAASKFNEVEPYHKLSSFNLKDEPKHGMVEVDSDGYFIYTPTGIFNKDTFVYSYMGTDDLIHIKTHVISNFIGSLV